MKLDQIPRLGLGDSKMSLDIGEYLYIHVLEYLFDIPILRFFFFIFEVFPGAYPFFKGGLGPHFTIGPPHFFG